MILYIIYTFVCKFRETCEHVEAYAQLAFHASQFKSNFIFFVFVFKKKKTERKRENNFG